MGPQQTRHFRFQVTMVTGVLAIVAIMVVATISMVLSVARRSAYGAAEERFVLASTAVRERTASILQPAVDLATVAASIDGIDVPVLGNGLDHPGRPLFVRMLSAQPLFYSAYIGFSDGSFLQVISGRQGPEVLAAHGAPGETDMIVRTITRVGDERVQRWSFLAPDGSLLRERVDASVEYDPRVRPWYEDAQENSGAVVSNPYVFNSLQEPGITAAHAIPGGVGVVGVDITTVRLTSFVSGQKISANGGVALFTGGGSPIAVSPVFDQIVETAQVEGVGLQGFLGWDGGRITETVLARSERWRPAANRELVVASAAPLEDFLTAARAMRRRIVLIALVVLVAVVPFVILFARQLSRALRDLASDAERVGRLDFGGSVPVRTPIYEFQQLGAAFAIMKSTIAERTGALELALQKLEMLVDMGIAMSAEFDLDKLSEMILSGAKRLTHADGGSLYLANDARDHLEFMIVLNDTLGFKQGGTSDSPITMSPVPLYDADGHENHHNVVTHAFHSERTENIPDAYNAGDYDFSGTRAFDAGNNYHSQSFLTVPLKPRGGGDVLGALQLINSIDQETGEIIPFPEALQGFVEALSSAAAVAVQNWKLMERQKRLFDDLVHFVGSAIDAKSPYTARHCSRVPEIARLLAEKAEAAIEEPFGSFRLSPAQKREFEIGAWLHDCGKITTPEYVVDKATKLETIYNRIHEVRTRFEVLLRDARIEYLTALLHGEDPTLAEKTFSATERELREDFSFLAECNVGTEHMAESKLQRLRDIGSRRWLRHFDDRLGLSVGEQRRLANLGVSNQPPVLPQEETLLANKPEHVVPRENWTQERYSAFGFSFNVPDNLYNRGELYNLSIRSGTLSTEERFKIDEHVAQTIVMLEHIPFPGELRRVPEYAGSHHEAPNGSGYPRGLSSGSLSLPSQMIAIADIFEALTSTDRPYKRDNTLSQAIDVLYRMAIDGKVNRDLFELLLRSGAYREYANAHLHPAQLDTVDVEKYLAAST